MNGPIEQAPTRRRRTGPLVAAVVVAAVGVAVVVGVLVWPSVQEAQKETAARDDATALRAQVAAAREQAERAGAAVGAADTWRQAEALRAGGQEAFDDGRFATAATRWDDALGLFGRAARLAERSVAAEVIGHEVALLCVNPACAYETRMDRAAYYQQLEQELTFEELHTMMPLRTACPQCGMQSVVQGQICPNCGKAFAPPPTLFAARQALGLPAPPPGPSDRVICPHCGTDINAYWAEHRTRAQR